jgi:two-component system, chemotaxis family, chemotaxis protein CheY
VEEVASRNGGHRHRILVVEDDERLLTAMVSLLRLVGYTSLGVPNGYAALERLRGEQPPCLILLDLMMPEMDGWQFRKRQLTDPKLMGVPVIVCSGHATDQDVASLGVQHCVEKPLDVRALLDLIANCCAHE